MPSLDAYSMPFNRAGRRSVAGLVFLGVALTLATCAAPPRVPERVLSQALPADTPRLIGQWYNDHPTLDDLDEALAIRVSTDGSPVLRYGTFEAPAERWPCAHCDGDAYAGTDRIGDPDMLYVVRGDGRLDLHVNCEFGPCTKKRTMEPLP